MKNVKTVVAGVLLAAAGLANAAGPVALSNDQMDNVSAGATALALALAGSFGDLISTSGASTVTSTVGTGFALSTASSGAIAASAFFGPAVASSSALAVATLP
jgi:hypothetical protein